MALLSSLHSRILPSAPKATSLLIAQKLEDTVIDFFERTRCYQSELAPQDIVVDTAEYTITPPASHVLVEPYEVRVNKIEVTEASEDELDLQWRALSRGYAYRLYHSNAFGGLDAENWRYAQASQPRFYYMARSGKLRLVGIPDTAYTGDAGLIFTGVWKPTIGVTQIDDAIFNDHYQALVDGALARLLVIPEKPWTNPKLAEMHRRDYEDAVGEAEAAISRNNQRDSRPLRTVACP